MSQINCYLPIKLRLVGEPSETQLEQLGQLLVRTLQARLAFAERTIAARYNLAALDGESDVREAYDPARAADGGGRYAIPAYDRQGQPVSVTVQARGRPWIIRRAIEFHAYVGAFLDLMERGGYRGADLAVYMDLFQEQRWVSLWQVQVNQSLLRSDLMQALATRVVQLSGVRNQTPYYAISGDEAFRQQLIEIDQDQIVAREIPALQRQTGTVAAGGDIRFPAGSQVLFASMMLPVITLQERAELGAALQVTVRLRDLTFVVNPVGFDRFERRFGLPWESYLHEYGDQAAFLHLQPLTIRKPTHISALTALVEQSVGQGLPSGPETVVYSRLDVLNNATLGQWPPLVREIGNRFSDEATRSLDKAQTSGQLEPKWKLAYVYTGLAISPQSVETARYRPSAGRQADLLIPLIGDRLVTVSERWAFIDFIKHNYTSLFPIPFEVLLDELKRRENGRWFERLFRATEEAADYETRLLIIRLARQTHYANDPAVVGLVNYHNQVNRQRSTGNVYNVASQQVILNKFFGDKTVSVNDIFYDVYNTYVHEEKRYKPKPQFAATWEANLLREAIDLIGRIDRGEDTQGLANGYSEIEFADAVLQAVFKRINITEKNYDDYFDTVTIQLSVRLLGLKKYTDELGIETVTVLYRVVEREKGGSWKEIGEVNESSDADFDYMIDRWVHEHVSAAIITFAHIALAIAAIGVAWEYGVIQTLTRIAGGARVVIPSVLLSAIFESIIHGFTFENFLIGAINGYLAALFFRGAGVLARGLFGRSITTLSFREGLLRWIGAQMFKGVVGGGTTGAAMRFTHDVYLVATGRGKWSSPAEYAESIGWGAALGVGAEFAGPLVLEPVLGKLAGGAADVARVLRANGVSPARWQAWSVQALSNMTKNLNELLASAPARAANLRAGFRLLYEQIGEAYAGLGGAIRGRVQLSVFRQLLEYSGEELSGSAAKGLEKFLQGAAGQLDENAALSLVKRIVGSGRGAKTFFETLNLLDENGVSQLISRGEIEGWLLVVERNIELTAEVRAGLGRLYGAALSRQAQAELLRLPAVDTVPELLGFLGRLGQGTVNDLAREGYLSPLARAPRVLRFVAQPENLDRLRRIVASARGGPTLDVVISSLERTLARNPDLSAGEIEAGVIRSRSPVVSGGGLSFSATLPGSTSSAARFTVHADGTVDVLNLSRDGLPKGSGGVMLASALRAAGASRPTQITLIDVVNDPTLQALRQGQDFTNTVLGETFATTAEELGGRIVEAKPFSYRVGSGRNRVLRYDVILKLVY